MSRVVARQVRPVATGWMGKAARLLIASLLASLPLFAVEPAPVEAYSTANNVSATDYVTDLFAEQFGFGVGPVGVAFDSSGNLFVADYPIGTLYKFPPGGGSANFATSNSVGSRVTGLAFTVDGSLYMAHQGNCCVQGDVVEVDPSTLTIKRTVASPIGSATGLAVDPLSGDLFVSQAGGGGSVFRISNFATGTGTVAVYANVQVDGIAFGPDGTLYGAGNGKVYTFPGTNVPTSDPWPGTPLLTVLNQSNQPAPIDGIGVGAGGQPNSPPFLYVNRNDGVITKVDLTTSPPTQTDIVTGGTRGDLVTVSAQGCLFATQSTSIVKVTDGSGNCNPPLVPTTPPPASTGPPPTATGLGDALAVINNPTCSQALPVNCASGNFTHTFVDASVVGPGPALRLARTYNSQSASSRGAFGFGWSSTYDIHLNSNANGSVTVTEEDGSQVTAVPSSGGDFTLPSWADSTLTHNPDGTWTFVRHQALTFTLTAAGQLSSIDDANGYRTSVSYDGSNRLSGITDPVGRSLAMNVGSNGLVSSVTDPLGLITHYSYDNAGNLTSVIDPAGSTTSFAYDAQHLLLTMTDPRGGTTTNTYDASARIVSQKDPLGRVTAFSYSGDNYSSLGGTTVITDPNGNIESQKYVDGELVTLIRGVGSPSQASWTYAYDPKTLGRSSITDPNGHVISSTFDSRGNLSTMADGLGRTQSFTYDALNDRTSVTDGLGVTTTYTYDSHGNLIAVSAPLVGTSQARIVRLSYTDSAHPGDITAIQDPNGKTTTMAYDIFGNRAQVIDADGNTTTSTYDLDGRLIATVSPNGNVHGANPAAYTTSFAYDALGSMTSTRDSLGHVASSTYDANANLVKAVDADGNTTTNLYDADNELVSITRADATTISTGYDANGNVIAQTDGTGAVTRYAYDPLNRVVSTTDPLGRVKRVNYDGVGNRTSLIDASGLTTTYRYDGANQPLGVSYSDGSTPAVSYVYDADGQRIRMTDGIGTTTYGYDSLNRLISEVDSAGNSLGYGYDLNGQLTSLTYPNSKAISRSYDPAGRMTAVSDWLGNTTRFSYDPSGNLTADSYPNNVVATSSFNAANQLTAINNAKGATTLASYVYGRDANGQVASATTTVGGGRSVELYSYSALNQLSSLNGAPYAYDHADNMVKSPLTSASFDNANELINANTGTAHTSLNYDPRGNRTLAVGPGVGPQACVLCLLSPNAAGTLSIGGSAQVQVGGVIAIDSASSSALQASGSSAVSGSQIFLAGGVSLSGSATLKPAPVSGRAAVTDPLASLPVPSITGSMQSITVSSGSQTASPGIYSSVSVSGTGSLTLAPGTYVITGRVSLSGSAVLTASGATIYLTCPSYPTPCSKGQSGAGFALSGASQANLNNGNTGPGGGVAIFADRQNAAAISLSNTGKLTVVGSVYAALGQLSLSGQSPGGLAITKGVVVVNNVQLSGSVTVGIDASGSAPSVSYSYDQANRLIGLQSLTTQATYGYDGDGRRVSKTVNGTTTRFVWDSTASASLLLVDGTDNYVYGPGGVPVETISGTTVTYLQQDQLGSTRELTDSGGAVVGTYSYDPYGNITTYSGTATTSLQYQGQYRDSESGLVYLRARYYDSTTGQFLSRDPLTTVTRTPYGYASGNPLTFTDPSGAYDYNHIWELGSTSDLGGPQAALSYLMSHAAEIFPFPLGSCSQITVGEICDLHPVTIPICVPNLPGGCSYVFPGWGGSDPIQVIRQTPCSFTFQTTGGVFSASNTVTFHTYTQNGELFLQQVAHAPNANGLVGSFAPDVAKVVWQQQANNLARALWQLHPHQPPSRPWWGPPPIM